MSCGIWYRPSSRIRALGKIEKIKSSPGGTAQCDFQCTTDRIESCSRRATAVAESRERRKTFRVESRSSSAAERARRPFLHGMNPHAVPVANDCVWCEYHNAMSTEFCTHCKQSHPGRACDFDDQGECAETVPEPETPGANSAPAKQASVPPHAGTGRD
jgi:hypothetical protein